MADTKNIIIDLNKKQKATTTILIFCESKYFWIGGFVIVHESRIFMTSLLLWSLVMFSERLMEYSGKIIAHATIIYQTANQSRHLITYLTTKYNPFCVLRNTQCSHINNAEGKTWYSLFWCVVVESHQLSLQIYTNYDNYILQILKT